MSNVSYLIANDIPGGSPDDVGRDRGEGEVLADGPCAVPVFWLALFDEADLVLVELEAEDGDETLKAPSLVTELDEARRRFRERHGLLSARFAEFEPTWDRFDALLQDLDARFIKIDVVELWDLAGMVEEDFEVELRAAVRWFESRDEEDFERLLSIASIQGYSIARRSFDKEGEGVPRAFHLRGYASSGAYWDNKADI